METLSNLVRSLAIIIILAGLLEMFLPSKNLKPSVQVIIGLFILVTILNPLLGLLNKEWNDDLQAWTGGEMGVSLEQILAKGEQIRKGNQAQAVEQYRQKLAAQVTGLANLVPGVQTVTAKVDVKEQGGLPGQVEKIQLTVISGGQAKAKSDGRPPLVPPVKIDLPESKSTDRDELEVSGKLTTQKNTLEQANMEKAIQKLRSTLANFYGIRPDAVEIQEIKEGKSSVR
ncbi:MAG: stage III sporulation protein AF [Carboxydocellales bacterium]